MLHLIADLNLNSEGGREGGQGRQGKQGVKMGTLRQKLFVENASTYSRGKFKMDESQNYKHTHALSYSSFNLKEKSPFSLF